MPEVIKVLLIDENENDVAFVKNQISQIKEIPIEISRIKGIDAAQNYLLHNSANIIFLSVNSPNSSGLDDVRMIVEIAPSLPVVVLTDSHTNGFAVKTIQTGAQDFLLKDKMNSDTVRRSMLYAIERKKNESALRESERKFKELANLLPQVVFETDLNGVITFANDFAFQLFGYSQADFLSNLSALQMLVQSDRQSGSENMLRVMNGDAPASHEYTALKKDGSTFPIMIFSSPIVKDEKTVGLRGVIVDITQRKDAEEKLVQLSRAVEQSPSSVIITDLEGRIEYVNSKFVSVTGYTLEEIKGKNPNILKSGFTPKEEYAIIWSTIKSGNEWKGEFHNKKKNGELFWESASISPILDNEGSVIHYLALKEDITDKKRYQSELIVAKEKAEQSDKLKSEFLAQMSHEIRTPLHAMLSFSKIIQEKTAGLVDANNEITYSLNGIDISGKRIMRTIDLIVNISQLHTGTYEFSPQIVDLRAEILSPLYEEYKPAAQKAGLEFSIVSEDCNTVSMIDKYSVQQIFDNLIDNAIKFTRKGSVKISLHRNHDKSLCIQISDTGIGISDEYLEKIFTPFSQEEQGYSRSFDGNGLGLALIKKYCDLNKILVEVQSRKGRGTAFTLTFPG